MSIAVNIRHDSPGSYKLLKLSVVEVGSPESNNVKLVQPGEATTLHVNSGQFVIVEETDSKEL